MTHSDSPGHPAINNVTHFSNCMLTLKSDIMSHMGEDDHQTCEFTMWSRKVNNDERKSATKAL